MKKAIVSLILIIGIVQMVHSQVYVDNQSQHRFAQTYVGLNALIVPSSGNFIVDDQSYLFPTGVIPRVTIGGLHFWGKWDFTINLPILFLGDFKIADGVELKYFPGGNFGARYYPWRMVYGKMRPYVGGLLDQQLLTLKDETRGHRSDLVFTLNPILGLSYAKNDWQLNIEASWMPNNERGFYSPDLKSQTIELPPVQFSIGILRYFDTTLQNEKNLLSGETERIKSMLRAQSKLNSISIGIGPSSSYFMTAPNYTDQVRRALPEHKGNNNWDLGLGYFFNNSGVHVGLSYRAYSSNVTSYDVEHVLRRKSIAFEMFKSLFDLGGFAPFFGPSISYERWGAGEFISDNQVGNTVETKMISPGFIFGWDILPSPLEKWVLRTNMRYYPFQKINDVTGHKSRIDQFEFNFIQLVIYPNRIINL